MLVTFSSIHKLVPWSDKLICSPSNCGPNKRANTPAINDEGTIKPFKNVYLIKLPSVKKKASNSNDLKNIAISITDLTYVLCSF